MNRKHPHFRILYDIKKDQQIIRTSIPALLQTLKKLNLLKLEINQLLKRDSNNYINLSPNFFDLLPSLIMCDTIEVKKICHNCKSLKMLKSRSHNYFCYNLIKDALSVFGNDAARKEFEINEAQETENDRMYITNNSYEKKIEFSRDEYNLSLFTFRLVNDGSVIYFHDMTNQQELFWKDENKRFEFKAKYWFIDVVVTEYNYSKWTSLNKITKTIAKKQLNVEDKRTFNDITCALNTYEKFLSKDGQKLLQILRLAEIVK